jgi:hypothetical protein
VLLKTGAAVGVERVFEVLGDKLDQLLAGQADWVVHERSQLQSPLTPESLRPVFGL